jgi:hypothetical protein
MDPVQLAILDLLKKDAVGSANAMNVDKIFSILNSQNIPVIRGRTQEHVRASVRSLIKDHGQLIGSNSGFGKQNGYFMITNKSEVVETIEDLRERSQGMLERAEALKQLWNSQNPTNAI